MTDAATENDTEAPEPEPEVSKDLAYGALVSWSRGQRVIHPSREDWLATAKTLLADGWNMCVDVTGVDYLSYNAERDLPPGIEPERFEVVATFVSHSRRERLRARAQVPESDPSIESLYVVYPGTDFLEREVYDLMGIAFVGHPDLSRILMPETWEGHPLRKDFGIGAIPVQFKAPSANTHR